MSVLTNTVHVDGHAGYVLPQVPPGAPPAVAEGIYRRRVTATTGECPPPCGAKFAPTREQRRRAARTGTPLVVQVQHEDGCPAITSVLDAAVRAWRAGGAT